jgi:hypothetical protein
MEGEAAAPVVLFGGFGDDLQVIFAAADAGVDPQVERLEEAEGAVFEEDFHPGRVMVVVEEGDGFSDEGHGGFIEAAV